MKSVKDEEIQKILPELAGLFCQIYGNRLKRVILYGSVARGTQEKDSDIDIMLLVDANDAELRNYAEQLTDVSTELALKYMKVFSIMDVNYQEYKKWKDISPFYKNVSKEGVVLYAA